MSTIDVKVKVYILPPITLVLHFVIALLAGFGGLVFSADKFVDGSVSIANFFKLSPLVIGLTIVALGTSAPEMFVSAIAAINGSPELAVGNALGSNIANIGMVLGITAICAVLPLASSVIKFQLPLFMGIMLLAGGLLYDAHLNRFEGIILISSLIVYLLLTIKFSSEDSIEQSTSEAMSIGKAWMVLIVSIISLVLFSQLLVWGAKGIAYEFGVSELIIGLTAVAIGTSLPELAATLMSTLKGERDLAIGNIIGSNVFNLLGVIGIAAFISPVSLEPEIMNRDYLTMFILSVLLCLAVLPKIWNNKANIQIGRLLGIIFLTGYISYFYLLF